VSCSLPCGLRELEFVPEAEVAKLRDEGVV
jgi:hypothetical protein